jgi:hypothetical protein
VPNPTVPIDVVVEKSSNNAQNSAFPLKTEEKVIPRNNALEVPKIRLDCNKVQLKEPPRIASPKHSHISRKLKCEGVFCVKM